MRGDRVRLVNGQPFRGLWDLRNTLQSVGPGQTLTFAVERPGASGLVRVNVRTEAYLGESPALADWLMALEIHIFTPLICLVLALVLAFLGDLDERGRVLSRVLIAFMAVYPAVGWSVALFPVALLFQIWAQGTIGYWLFRLGLVFPYAGGPGSRPTWLRQVVGFGVWGLLAIKAASEVCVFWWPLNAGPALAAASVFAGQALQVLNVLCAALFIANLASKALARQSVDGRRRLRILTVGSIIGLGPFTSLVVWGLITGQGLFHAVPLWTAEFSLLLMAIFPATLAYVVAVPRAMDLRVMLRQALYYSSAYRSLAVQRLLVLGAAFSWLAVALNRAGVSSEKRVLLILGALGVAAVAQEGLLKWLRVWLNRKYFRETYNLDSISGELRRVRDTDPARYLGGVLDLVEDVIPFRGGTVFCIQDGVLQPLRAKGMRPLSGVDAALVQNSLDESGHPVELCWREPRDWMHELTREQSASDTSQDLPEIMLPLRGSESVVGMLLFSSKKTDEPYTPTDKAALVTIGESAGLVLENLVLMSARDAETAHRERRRAEAQAADDASRAKSEFLARMSHELRTPLNAILGYSEMLVEEAEDTGQDQFAKDLGKIRSAGKHLLDLINSILDISKIEAGKVEVYAETIRIEQLVADVASMLSPLVAAKGNRLETTLHPAAGVMHTDAGKLRQILINLLSNASKFTERGTIALRCLRQDDGHVRFEVQDSGIGMTPAQMSKLFQPFQQADASISAKYGGTGLGLTICKKFCELLGGQISVDSVAGQGTTFSVLLPEHYGEMPSPGTTAAPASGAHGPLVLLIDDDLSVLDVFSRSLAKEGFRTALASDAKTGLQLARELSPDAILLDVMLGGADGMSVMAELQQGEHAPPVILMSSLDQSQKGIALGAEGFLVKPIDRHQLKQALEAVIPKANAFGRALVIDGQPKDRLMLRRLMQEQGWRVSESATGKEGLQILQREHLAVVLGDLLMPGRGGLQFLSEMRAQPGNSDIPVIVVADRRPAAENEGSAPNDAAPSKECAEQMVREVVTVLGRDTAERAKGAAV